MLSVLNIAVCQQPVQATSNTWRERGVRMAMVRFWPRHAIPPAVAAGVELHPTFSRNKLAFVPDAVRLGARLHAAAPFDCILADDPMGSGLAGWLLKRKLNIPLIIRCHTQYFGHRAWVFERSYYPLYYLLARFLLPRADGIETVSAHVGRTVEAFGIAPGRIAVVYPPIQTSCFFPPPTPRIFGGRLLFVGQLLPGKGLLILIEALQILRARGWRPRLEIVGSGPQEAALKRRVHSLGLDDAISFAGFVPRAQLAARYGAADVLVLPTFYEAFGRVCLEAALCGLPVVASDVGGVNEAVSRGETALLVPPKNPVALADALQTFFDDPPRAAAMGAAGLAFARASFDFEAIRDAMVASWRKVVEERD